jgi:hypothetical protein
MPKDSPGDLHHPEKQMWLQLADDEYSMPMAHVPAKTLVNCLNLTQNRC